jgi:hypothetical protein
LILRLGRPALRRIRGTSGGGSQRRLLLRRFRGKSRFGVSESSRLREDSGETAGQGRNSAVIVTKIQGNPWVAVSFERGSRRTRALLSDAAAVQLRRRRFRGNLDRLVLPISLVFRRVQHCVETAAQPCRHSAVAATKIQGKMRAASLGKAVESAKIQENEGARQVWQGCFHADSGEKRHPSVVAIPQLASRRWRGNRVARVVWLGATAQGFRGVKELAPRSRRCREAT